ncbi:LEF-1 [Mythimna sequax nucleopolyhedrovirus]|nr:LEF-1 [Mythimna sequax nucleopolyhedrovirus]
MWRSATVYTQAQLELMWNSVAFRDCRKFAFSDGKHWYHPDQHFDNIDDFGKFIRGRGITDVHAKPLENNGGREWVIDVDVEAADETELNVKIKVAAATMSNFFGDNIARIMHSGNRGIHVWLRIDRFPMHASKQYREKYYKVFALPKELDDTTDLPEGCFALAYRKAVQQISECRNKPLLSFWPTVDKHVFCNLTQIRVPHSYNFKGKKFSKQLS